MGTVERGITEKISYEFDNVVATVDTTVHDATVAAIEGLTTHWVELKLKLFNAFFERGCVSFVLYPILANFSENSTSLQFLLHLG